MENRQRKEEINKSIDELDKLILEAESLLENYSTVANDDREADAHFKSPSNLQSPLEGSEDVRKSLEQLDAVLSVYDVSPLDELPRFTPEGAAKSNRSSCISSVDRSSSSAVVGGATGNSDSAEIPKPHSLDDIHESANQQRLSTSYHSESSQSSDSKRTSKDISEIATDFPTSQRASFSSQDSKRASVASETGLDPAVGKNVELSNISEYSNNEQRKDNLVLSSPCQPDIVGDSNVAMETIRRNNNCDDRMMNGAVDSLIYENVYHKRQGSEGGNSLPPPPEELLPPPMDDSTVYDSVADFPPPPPQQPKTHHQQPQTLSLGNYDLAADDEVRKRGPPMIPKRSPNTRLSSASFSEGHTPRHSSTSDGLSSPSTSSSSSRRSSKQCDVSPDGADSRLPVLHHRSSSASYDRPAHQVAPITVQRSMSLTTPRSADYPPPASHFEKNRKNSTNGILVARLAECIQEKLPSPPMMPRNQANQKQPQIQSEPRNRAETGRPPSFTPPPPPAGTKSPKTQRSVKRPDYTPQPVVPPSSKKIPQSPQTQYQQIFAEHDGLDFLTSSHQKQQLTQSLPRNQQTTNKSHKKVVIAPQVSTGGPAMSRTNRNSSTSYDHTYGSHSNSQNIDHSYSSHSNQNMDPIYDVYDGVYSQPQSSDQLYSQPGKKLAPAFEEPLYEPITYKCSPPQHRHEPPTYSQPNKSKSLEKQSRIRHATDPARSNSMEQTVAQRQHLMEQTVTLRQHSMDSAAAAYAQHQYNRQITEQAEQKRAPASEVSSSWKPPSEAQRKVQMETQRKLSLDIQRQLSGEQQKRQSAGAATYQQPAPRHSSNDPLRHTSKDPMRHGSNSNTMRHNSNNTLRHSNNDAVRHSYNDPVRPSNNDQVRHSYNDPMRQSNNESLRHSSTDPLRHSSADPMRHSSIETQKRPQNQTKRQEPVPAERVIPPATQRQSSIEAISTYNTAPPGNQTRNRAQPVAPPLPPNPPMGSVLSTFPTAGRSPRNHRKDIPPAPTYSAPAPPGGKIHPSSAPQPSMPQGAILQGLANIQLKKVHRQGDPVVPPVEQKKESSPELPVVRLKRVERNQSQNSVEQDLSGQTELPVIKLKRVNKPPDSVKKTEETSDELADLLAARLRRSEDTTSNNQNYDFDNLDDLPDVPPPAIDADAYSSDEYIINDDMEFPSPPRSPEVTSSCAREFWKETLEVDNGGPLPPPPPALIQQPVVTPRASVAPPPAPAVTTRAAPSPATVREQPQYNRDFSDIDLDISQIPGYQVPPENCPHWKKQMIEKKNKDLYDKYMSDRNERMAEEAKWQTVPSWKRNLMEKKEQKKKQELAPNEQSKQRQAEEEARLQAMPEWKRNIILKKRAEETSA